METISWNDFEKVELRVGRVVSAETFPEARKPAYVLHVDFGGEIGTRKSSVQVTGGARGEAGRGRGEFSQETDWTTHVRVPGHRLSR